MSFHICIRVIVTGLSINQEVFNSTDCLEMRRRLLLNVHIRSFTSSVCMLLFECVLCIPDDFMLSVDRYIWLLLITASVTG